HRLPPTDSIRVEEFVNYFNYDLDAPNEDDDHPINIGSEITRCPWNDESQLVRISLATTVPKGKRPPCNLVFLIDTSGSMKSSNKLPLAIEGLRKLTKNLREDDRIAIVVYASSTGVVLESTPGDKKKKIRKALSSLEAGGSTNGGAGIRLAYDLARDYFIEDGVNRVMLCTDGDFNVGTTSDTELVDLIAKQSAGGIDLTVLGFGSDNLNDAMLEQISGRGNGNYAFIDSSTEANRVLVRQMDATMVTVARDVKIQVEFNPAKVSRYRLVGYQNRRLANADFANDKKDAGEIGTGHQVTALYELQFAGVNADGGVEANTSQLRYQTQRTELVGSEESFHVKVRYKPVDDVNAASTLIEKPVQIPEELNSDGSTNQQLAVSMAQFALKLRRSDSVKELTWQQLKKSLVDLKDQKWLAEQSSELDSAISMIRQASELAPDVDENVGSDEPKGE
ncbi:MAG: von Willebrand factor type A domain-containing protein, partial [Planctomycetota bacterium]